MSIATVSEQQALAEDEFELDVTLVESGPVIPELLASTSDNCGKIYVFECYRLRARRDWGERARIRSCVVG
jgi:FxLD family lantipeptide